MVALDGDDRVLLIKAHDPARPDAGSWWELPGGGIEPGEASTHACLRELHEEGGITTADIGPVIWIQHVTFDFAGWHFDQDEVIHVARVPSGSEGLGEQRLEGVSTLPPRLAELLGPVVDGDLPDPPLDISPHLDGATGR